jgi:hypothetical protein
MEHLEIVIRNARLAADAVAMQPHPTEARRTHAIVQRAFEFAVANGMIEVTDPSTWREWMSLDPPYDGWPQAGESDG